MSDSFLDQVNSRSRDNLLGHLGMVITKIEENYAEATMPVDERTIQIYGYLHGGATIALAETIAGVGSAKLIYPYAQCVGMNVSANHIHSAKKGESVIAKAHLIHKGQRSHIWEVKVYKEGSEQLISNITVTNAIVSPK